MLKCSLFFSAMLLSKVLRSTPRISAMSKRAFSATSIHDEFTEDAESRAKRDERRRKRADEDEETRTKILESSLKFVPELGWSREAIKQGAIELGYPEVTSGIIEHGAIDLVHFHVQKSDETLSKMMQAETEDLRSKNERLRIGPFIKSNVKSRLSLNIPVLSRWSDAMALMTQPQNLPSSLELDLKLMYFE